MLNLRLFKVHARERGVTYREALDEALCFGWIDGVRRAQDADSFTQRFTPRRRGSKWSQVNTRRMRELQVAGLAAAPGLAAWKAAPKKPAGYSFESKPVALAKNYLSQLQANAAAYSYFQQQAPWYRRTSSFWVMSAMLIVDGLYLAGGRQHVDNHTFIRHAKPHCHSFELYKGILDGHSRGVFNGRIYVDPIAQKTDAKQENNCMLLSDDARINSNPQLEIFADDVKCTHGAAIGKTDDDAVFYMRSRGIPATDARDLMVYAFASEVLERIGETALKLRLEDDLFAWLERSRRERG